VPDPIRLTWSAAGAAVVDEVIELPAAGPARLTTLRAFDPDRLDRAGVFAADVSAAARAALEAALDAMAAGPVAEPRPGAVVLLATRGATDLAVPAPDRDEGPDAELHRAAVAVAREVAASPLAAVRLVGSVFGPVSVTAGGIPRIDVESIGSEPVGCQVHLAGLRFVAETGEGIDDWLDAGAVARTGGLLTSLGRLVARDEVPAELAPGSRAGLAVPDGLRPSHVGPTRLHARLPLALEAPVGAEPAEIELVSPWVEIVVDP
jgi:hypothetical protein